MTPGLGTLNLSNEEEPELFRCAVCMCISVAGPVC